MTKNMRFLFMRLLDDAKLKKATLEQRLKIEPKQAALKFVEKAREETYTKAIQVMDGVIKSYEEFLYPRETKE